MGGEEAGAAVALSGLSDRVPRPTKGDEVVTLESEVRRLLIEANLPVAAEIAIRLIAKAVEDHAATCTHPQPPVPRPEQALMWPVFGIGGNHRAEIAYNRINEIREDREQGVREWER